MPLYTVKSVNYSGKRFKDEIEAPHLDAIKNILREKGLIAVEIKEIPPRRPLFRKITDRDILAFTQELRSLIESGFPVDRALRVLSDHSAKPLLRRIILSIYTNIEQGLSLSQAISKRQEFSPVYNKYDTSWTDELSH